MTKPMLSIPLNDGPEKSSGPEENTNLPVTDVSYVHSPSTPPQVVVPAFEIQATRDILLKEIEKAKAAKQAHLDGIEKADRFIEQMSLSITIINGLLKKSRAI